MEGDGGGVATMPTIGTYTARPVLPIAVEARVAFDGAVEKIRAAVGTDTSVALARPDAGGRLRVVRRDGLLPPKHRDRSGRRRAALEARRSVLRRLDCGHAVGIVPLTTEAHTIGVLEVVAPASQLSPAWDLVQLIAAQLALTAESLAQRALLEREAETLQLASVLGNRLVRAHTIDDAIVMAVRFLADRFHVPVAGWCPNDGAELRLVSVAGVRAARRLALTDAFGSLGRTADGLDPEERDALADRFRRIVDVPSATSPDAGTAVLVVGRRGDAGEGSLDAVASLLADVLRLVAAATTAARRHARLDMGLAWTAHELRGPLVGVRAALEAIGNRHDDPREAAIVSSSVRELDHLMGTTEALLGWAAGTQPLQRARHDLVALVGAAVESCRHETGASVGLRAPRRAVAEVDPMHVRTAVANLLRNAAAHADPGTEVEVRVRADDERITVSVTDEGPQIPSSEREAIFEPFARGEVSARSRNGAGLGLFITRRIVEAHGGGTWVDSGPHRTTFHLSFPIEVAQTLTKEVHASAS